MPLRDVFYIYVQYGDVRQVEGVQRLLQFHKERFKGYRKKIIVIDNKVAGKNIFVEYNEDLIKISGDNWNREFSAYDLGVDFIKRTLNAKDDAIVVVANDTFYTNYGDAYLRKFNKKTINYCIRKKGILGHVDEFPKSVVLDGLTFQKWIRTSFFVSSVGVLSLVNRLSIPWSDKVLFDGGIHPFFSEHAPLSENYKKYLSQWLFDFDNKVSEFPFEWHSKKTLDHNNLSDFQGKVRSILAEHYFSARAIDQKIPLISV